MEGLKDFPEATRSVFQLNPGGEVLRFEVVPCSLFTPQKTSPMLWGHFPFGKNMHSCNTATEWNWVVNLAVSQPENITTQDQEVCMGCWLEAHTIPPPLQLPGEYMTWSLKKYTVVVFQFV